MSNTAEASLMLSTMLGEETWKNGTFKLYVFGLHYPGMDKVKEASITSHAKDVEQQGVVQVRKSNVKRRAEGARKELGHWTAATFALVPGAVLKLYAYKAGEFGRKPLIVNQLIRMREDASINKLTLPLSNHEGAINQRAQVMGRFDLITVEQAEAYGVSFDIRKRKLYTSNWSEGLTLEEVEAGQPLSENFKSVEVTNSEGKTTTLTTRKRRRNVS